MDDAQRARMESVLRVLQNTLERGGYRSGKKIVPFTGEERSRLLDRIVAVRQELDS